MEKVATWCKREKRSPFKEKSARGMNRKRSPCPSLWKRFRGKKKHKSRYVPEVNIRLSESNVQFL
jgi:hypothetical protein